VPDLRPERRRVLLNAENAALRDVVSGEVRQPQRQPIHVMRLRFRTQECRALGGVEVSHVAPSQADGVARVWRKSAVSAHASAVSPALPARG